MPDDVIRSPGSLRMPTVPDRYRDVSDAALALAIGRYEQSALAEAYRRHAGAVYGLAIRLLRATEVAEDIVQEIFLRFWNDPTRFDPERGGLRSYLLAETHGRAVDMLRADLARRGREDRDARRTADAGYDIAHQVVDLATSEDVRRSMAALSDDERRAIELAYFGGYTYREVARQLDQPEGTVKSRIRSGLRRLRRELVSAGITGGEL
jgi:RNA polymerase sigma-70 factor (ECF subfamily)